LIATNIRGIILSEIGQQRFSSLSYQFFMMCSMILMQMACIICPTRQRQLFWCYSCGSPQRITKHAAWLR